MQQDQVGLITGCSSGVGMYSAVLLAQEGYRVYATMRDTGKAKELESLARQNNVELRILPLDVQNEHSVHSAVTQIIAESGKIDVLVNNAGFGSVKTLEQATFWEIEEIMDVNFFGAIRCIRAVLPGMRERKSGHILSVSSVGGLVGQPLNEIYCSAKFALEGLIESMATYLQPFFNIRMTLIEPGGIKSQFVGRIASDLAKSSLPLQEAYGPILEAYQKTIMKRGAFDQSAQTPAQVAEIIVQAIKGPTQDLRIQTSELARDFAHEKLEGDPSGNLLQKRIRKLQLDISL